MDVKFLVTYATFHFYNVLDAVASASRRNLGMTFDVRPSGNSLMFSLNRRF
jgi:hypothetical protein